MRRSVGIILSTLLSIALLAGCSGGNQNLAASGAGQNSVAQKETPKSQDAGSNSPSGDKTNKLTLWTFSDLHINFYKEMEKEWNTKNPDQQINLEINTLPYDDMHNKLLLALQSGKGAPDLADIEISKFGNFLKGTPQLLELNDIVTPVLDKLVKSRVENFSKNGKNYGIDFHVGASVIYYNKEILDKAGVNPDSIETWDDFDEAGKQVVAKTGKPIVTLETSDMWQFWPMISQQSSDILDKNGQPMLDNEISVKTLQFEQKLLKDKVAIISPGGNNNTEEFYGFMNKGGAAAIIMPMWYMVRLTDYMPDLKGKMIIRPMPAWKPGGFRSAGMGGTGTAVTNQAKNPELAKKFLAFAKLSKEGSIQIWKLLGFDPMRIEVWDDPEMKASNKFTDYFGPNIFDNLKTVKDEINPVNIGEKTPAASNAIRKELLSRVLQNGEDPAKVLKEVADELRR